MHFIRLDQLVFEPDAATKFDGPGNSRDEVVGAHSSIKPSRSCVSRTPPVRSACSKTVTLSWLSSSIRRCAVARPEIPPPMTATRFREGSAGLMSEDSQWLGFKADFGGSWIGRFGPAAVEGFISNAIAGYRTWELVNCRRGEFVPPPVRRVVRGLADSRNLACKGHGGPQKIAATSLADYTLYGRFDIVASRRSDQRVHHL